IAQEVKPLFEELGEAFRARDRNQILACFDPERLYDELLALGVFPKKGTRERRAFIRGMREGLGKSLRQQRIQLEWVASEIRSVKKLAGNEAVVIIRHRTTDHLFLKMRWWVTKQGGTWKVYDLEDLNTGIRMTTMVTSLVGAGREEIDQIGRALTNIQEALVAAVLQQDLEAAERKLRLAQGVRLPAKLEAFRLMVTGVIQLRREQYQEALESLERAHRTDPDIPCLDVLRGTALNRLGEWEKALKHLEAYRKLLGDDPEVCREIGLSLRGLRRFADAARSYRKALDLAPKDDEAFRGLLLSLNSDDDQEDVEERFARLDDHRATFDVCAEDRRQSRDHKGLEHLTR